MICSAEGWVAVYGSDPETQRSWRIACWAVSDPLASPLDKFGVEGLIVDPDSGRLISAQDRSGFVRYEYQGER